MDGEGVSALLTWDSKVLTVVALLGGVQDLVRDRMKQDGIYHEFIRIAEVRETPFLDILPPSPPSLSIFPLRPFLFFLFSFFFLWIVFRFKH